MGRGVMTEGDHIVYFDATGIEDSFDWDDMQENIVHSLEKQYPSLNRVKKWQDREIAVILENYHIQIGISEYCGCGAVSVFVNEQCFDYPPHDDMLAKHWLEQCWPKIEKIITDNVWGKVLNRIGTMSNGVSVYKEK